MPNYNEKTGVPFGYIKVDALAEGILDNLTSSGTNVTYTEALKAYLDVKRDEHEEMMEDKRIARAETDGGTLSEEDDVEFDEDEATEKFNDEYQGEEEIYEGDHGGVKYRTSWLGGAQNLWVFESPVRVRCRVCSPCVPGAGDLNNVGVYEAYGLPAHWLSDEFLKELCEADGFVVGLTDPYYHWFWKGDVIQRKYTPFGTEADAWTDCYHKRIVVP